MLPSSLLLLSTLSATAVSACKNATQLVQTTAITEIPSATLDIGATCACAQLAAVYGDLVLYSNATNYSTENVDFWDVRSADLKPKCVFLPNDADQVAGGVSILAGCGSQFAIRGGGHMNVRVFCSWRGFGIFQVVELW